MNEIATEKRYAIIETGQLTVGDLRIGVGNFWPEAYPDENNQPQPVPTCGLWFYVRNHPEQDRHERVRSGHVTEIAGYRIDVEGIEREADEQSMVLLIITPLG